MSREILIVTTESFEYLYLFEPHTSLQVKLPRAGYSLKIYDQLGLQKQYFQFLERQTELNLENLPNGTYQLIFEFGQQNIVKQLLIFE